MEDSFNKHIQRQRGHSRGDIENCLPATLSYFMLVG